MNASIRYFSVARDEFEGGNCPECARCGSTMRHVTEINGRTYGSGCGKIIIEEMNRRANQIKEVAKTIPAVMGMLRYWDIAHIEARIESCERRGEIKFLQAWKTIREIKQAS